MSAPLWSAVTNPRFSVDGSVSWGSVKLHVPMSRPLTGLADAKQLCTSKQLPVGGPPSPKTRSAPKSGSVDESTPLFTHWPAMLVSCWPTSQLDMIPSIGSHIVV